MPKQSAVDFKINFIKFLSSLKGLPKVQQQQFERIIARIKQPDIVISSEDKKAVSTIIAALFCGVKVPNFPMHHENKVLVESYSDQHLRELTAKSTAAKSRKST